jgi:diadenosine tetraphosphate (Ap4A) HIT family hydrolase
LHRVLTITTSFRYHPCPHELIYCSVIYDIHQNNGAIAHQVVKHVHFHVIPKPSESNKEGLVIEWPVQDLSKDDIETLWKDLQPKL